MRSLLLNKKTAEEAVQIVLPAIQSAMETGLVKRKDLHVVILDPAVKCDPWSSIEEAVLYEQSLGDIANWEHDYVAIARAKADISWKTGFPSQAVQELFPHFLEGNDTVHAGSAVVSGIIVGISGVQWYFDQMFAEMVATACKALCIQKRKAIKETRDFLPEDFD